MSVLLIEIPPATPITAHTPLRHVVSADGQTVERSGVAVAALLPKPGRAAAVTLVLPPQALSWHRVLWPKVALRDRARARAVLHGLLEEQLLDDGAQLHMALAPDVRPGAATWVAVCDQAWLQGAVEVLAQAGVPVHRMVPVWPPQASEGDEALTPQLLALGTPEDAWLAVTHADAEGRTLCVPLTPAVAQMDIVSRTAADAVVQAEPAVYQQAQQVLGRAVQLLEWPQHLLQAAQTPWNLAQFQFANSGKDRFAQGISGNWQAVWRQPQWRWARVAVLLLVLVNLVGLNVLGWQARQQLQGLRGQVDAVFRSTFPQIPVVVDAPLQMQRELARLQQQSGAVTPAAFEALASAAGSALQRAGVTAMPTAMRYDGQFLTLQGLVLPEAQMQQWQTLLLADGLNAVPGEDASVQIGLVRSTHPKVQP